AALTLRYVYALHWSRPQTHTRHLHTTVPPCFAQMAWPARNIHTQPRFETAECRSSKRIHNRCSGSSSCISLSGGPTHVHSRFCSIRKACVISAHEPSSH